ncbi:hypothetical protein H6F67_19395 [Microcoleus sp. FACHB-1515]|uniref:hypothetical protein n=1 Tax=Cyanophyceae TaxID=3028117 RepID=UPI0016893353|nr:hypothetical protein [Microcoleus sp. FACHB-1515]MBD2092016.1 hypothetical protein [Microcoleus sp. FACHB-1515]
MNNTPKFIFEVLAVSLLIAVLIKAIGPALPIPATNFSAIAIVLTPTLVMGSLLLWRAVRYL